MKIGLVGPSYQMRSLPFDAQRTINLFPVADRMGKEAAALYGTPGLKLFATVGGGPVRGIFYAGNGRCFVVSGSEVYEVYSDATTILRGTVAQTTGNVTMDENPAQMGICDGGGVYILTYDTNVYAQVADPDLSAVGTLTVLDNTFIVNENDSGRFFISAAGDGTSWDALDFATAESSPDNLLRVLNGVGQLFLFGARTTEIWTNTGASSFPFGRISGGKLEAGILAPYTAVPVDNVVFWLGRNNHGQGIVYRAQGFTPERVSTDAVEYAIQRAASPEDIIAWSYQQEGHTFYILTGGGLETSLAYDTSTGLWHERAYLNADGEYEAHRANCYALAFGKNLVGDKENGNIYELDLYTYTDAGQELARERVYTHLSNENARTRYSTLEIDFESGVGLQSGLGSDPQAMLQISKDGARTWSDTYRASIGAAGQYRRQVRFRRLGMAEQMTFRVRVTDPVKVVMIGSYLS
jgi:hypothetical protein